MRARIPLLTATMGVLFYLASCWPIPTLHPLFEEEDLVLEPGLVGTWVEEGDDGVLIIRDSKVGWYRVAYLEDETMEAAGMPDSVTVDRLIDTATCELCLISEKMEDAWLKGALGDLGGRLFMDLSIPAYYDDGPPFATPNLLAYFNITPVHTIWRVQLQGDTLLFQYLDYEEVEELVDDGAAQLSHVLGEEDVWIVTASTEELQDFVRAHADNEDIWNDDDDRFVRKR